LVPPGFVSDEAFLAGYGAAQAVPGPLFTLSAYLGVLMSPGPWSWAGGLAAVFAMFLPAWLLVGGALPFWQRLRTRPWAQAALRGANAAVVGVLAAALWMPVGTEGIRSWLDLLLAAVGFVLLERFKVPAWALVAGLGLACSI
jgi:chromate transporter